MLIAETPLIGDKTSEMKNPIKSINEKVIVLLKYSPQNISVRLADAFSAGRH